MTVMAKLSFTVPIRPNESLQSYCSRIAALNGMETAKEFSSHFGFDFGRLSQGWHGDIVTFGRLVGKEMHQLESSIIVQSRAFVETAQGAFSREFIDANRCRICPACTLRDIGTVYNAYRAYGRIEWMLRFVHTCPEHRIPLMKVSGLRNDSSDFSRQLRQILLELERHADVPQREASTGLQDYVIHRIGGGRSAGLWLDNFPIQAAAHFTELFGAICRDGPEPDLESFDDNDWIEVAEIGFRIVQMGRDVVERELARFIDIETNSRKIRSSVFFGRLPHELLNRADLPGYLELLNFLESIVRVRHPQMVSDLPT